MLSLWCTSVSQDILYQTDLKCCVSGLVPIEHLRGPRFISASLSDYYFLPQLVGTPWDHISCGCYGEVASWCLCIVSMSENTFRKLSVSVWVWHVLLIRMYFGGNFSGLGPLTTLFLGTVYSISADIRNTKQLVDSLVSTSVAFSVSTQEPIGKGCSNSFAAWGPSQIEKKVSAVAKSPKVSGQLIVGWFCCDAVEEINHAPIIW